MLYGVSNCYTDSIVCSRADYSENSYFVLVSHDFATIYHDVAS
jgi:hypothetical protein